MADRVSKSQKWLIQGQVEYFTPFTMLWVALLNWCREQDDFAENNNTDNSIIEYLKNTSDSDIREHFTRKLRTLDEFRRNLGDLAAELEDTPLLNNQETRIDFTDLKATQRGEGYECSRYKFTYSENDIYDRLLDCIYQVRCNYIHGNFDPDDQGTRTINEKSYHLLNTLLREIIEI